MFITEVQLDSLKNSVIEYKYLPHAAIFFHELKNKQLIGAFNPNLFYNFFNRFNSDDGYLEVIFGDHSIMVVRYKARECDVYQPRGVFTAHYSF